MNGKRETGNGFMPAYPNRYTRGGGGGFSLAFPPFHGAVRALVLINAAVYFAVLFGNIAAHGFDRMVFDIFGFIPAAALHGWLWQFITYGFLHDGLSHILVNMLMLWMFGSTLEGGWGRRKFLQLYSFCLVGAALTTMALGYAGYEIYNSQIVHTGTANPFWASLAALIARPTVGASGAIYGVLIAFGIIYKDQELFLFPFPFRIKAKYMVAILVAVVFASALQPGVGGVATFAHLGGLLFGWLFVRLAPVRGFDFSISERYYAIRNSYYRWKRRRAGRKFQVYMRNRGEYFDEHGNYRDPKKGNGEHRGPWVN
jgi:membrane associated rhomboid family serine protease